MNTPLIEEESKISNDNIIDNNPFNIEKENIFSKNLLKLIDEQNLEKINKNKRNSFIIKTNKHKDLFPNNTNEIKYDNSRKSYEIKTERNKNSNKLKRTKSNIIQEDLMLMGFDLKLINNIIKYYEIYSLELAIEYLTKTNDKWNHPFVSLEIPDNPDFFPDDYFRNNVSILNIKNSEKEIKCLVCEESTYNHLNFSKFKNISSQNNSMKSFSDSFYKSNSVSSKSSKKDVDETFLNQENIFQKDLLGENEGINFKALREKLLGLINSDNQADKLNISENKIEILKINKTQEPKYCEICMSDSSDYHELTCKHIFCRECLSLYLIEKFNNSEVEEILCPNSQTCKISLNSTIINLLVPVKEFLRYEKFLIRRKILKDPNLVLCPIPNCESYAVLPENYQNEKIILVCKEKEHHAFCSKCKKYAHGDSDCGKKIEEEYRNLTKNTKHIRKCPRCNFFIEKNQGCNHMTCGNKECAHEFCWVCMGNYSTGHFDNPLFRCFGLQYTNQNSIFVSCPILGYLKCLLLFILCIISIPLMIIFVPISPPILLFYYVIKNEFNLILNYHSKLFFYILATNIYFCIGLITLPFGCLCFVLGIIFGFFFGIYLFFNFFLCCCKRNRN